MKHHKDLIKKVKIKWEGELFKNNANKIKLFYHNVNKVNLVHTNGMSQRS